jgi:tripartite-type tricarboxylate transporter receptor subunit TctC
MKRTQFCLFVAGALMAASLPVFAQTNYPEKPIRLVVPSAAGGSPDAMMRLLGAELTKAMGQAVVIENKPGAGGQTGLRDALTSPADGYTLAYGNVVTMAVNQSLYSKLNYDPVKDIAPVALVAFTQNALVVRNDLPVKTVAELIAYLKKNPGKVTMGSAGNGTTSHLSGELFKSETDTFMLHVPYRGSPAAITDLIGGQIDVMFDNLASIGTHIKSGKVRALAVTGAKRSPLYPDLPTVQEAGVKNFETVAWGGVIAPAGTPPAIIQKLNTEINKILTVQSVKDRFAAIGFETVTAPPAALTQLAVKETPRWAAVIKRSGAKVD